MTNKPAGNGFFNRPGKGLIQVTNSSSGIYVGGFISGIKVYAYANEHAPERKMILGGCTWGWHTKKGNQGLSED